MLQIILCIKIIVIKRLWIIRKKYEHQEYMVAISIWENPMNESTALVEVFVDCRFPWKFEVMTLLSHMI